MTKQEKVFRTERVWLKPTQTLRKYCHLSKNLYNEANYLVRQTFFNEGKWLRAYQVQQEVQSSLNFKELPFSTALKVIKLVEKAWKSFHRALSDL